MPKAKKNNKNVKVMKPVPNEDKLQFEVKEKQDTKLTEKDIFEGIKKKDKSTDPNTALTRDEAMYMAERTRKKRLARRIEQQSKAKDKK